MHFYHQIYIRKTHKIHSMFLFNLSIMTKITCKIVVTGDFFLCQNLYHMADVSATYPAKIIPRQIMFKKTCCPKQILLPHVILFFNYRVCVMLEQWYYNVLIVVNFIIIVVIICMEMFKYRLYPCYITQAKFSCKFNLETLMFYSNIFIVHKTSKPFRETNNKQK